MGTKTKATCTYNPICGGEKRIPKHGDENIGFRWNITASERLVKKESPNMGTKTISGVACLKVTFTK